MERCINHFVRKELFADKECPPTTNRRFFPRKKDIRNHMYAATVKYRFSKIDQEQLEYRVGEWKKENPSDSFFFRPYVKDADYEERQEGNSHDVDDVDDVDDADADNDDIKVNTHSTADHLLFIHQTANQKHLLQRYGNELVLLDATYRTTRYSLPLFFLAVKTNVDYQVVASFVIQDESTDSIKEALEILKGWNPEWQPSFCMTDFCEEEITAMEEVFPGDYESLPSFTTYTNTAQLNTHLLLDELFS